jgi:hypothetical protein
MGLGMDKAKAKKGNALFLLRSGSAFVNDQSVQEIPEHLITAGLEVFMVLMPEKGAQFGFGDLEINKGQDLHNLIISQLQGHP